MDEHQHIAGTVTNKISNENGWKTQMSYGRNPYVRSVKICCVSVLRPRPLFSLSTAPVAILAPKHDICDFILQTLSKWKGLKQRIWKRLSFVIQISVPGAHISANIISFGVVNIWRNIMLRCKYQCKYQNRGHRQRTEGENAEQKHSTEFLVWGGRVLIRRLLTLTPLRTVEPPGLLTPLPPTLLIHAPSRKQTRTTCLKKYLLSYYVYDR